MFNTKCRWKRILPSPLIKLNTLSHKDSLMFVSLNFRDACRRLTPEIDYDNIVTEPHTYRPDSRLLLNS